jgi:hypothetical protein
VLWLALLYFDGALVAPPPACAETSEPSKTIPTVAAAVMKLLCILPSIRAFDVSSDDPLLDLTIDYAPALNLRK